MDIELLNKLKQNGDLSKLYQQGLVKPEIFVYIDIYNKYRGLKGLMKKKSNRVKVLCNYFKYSKGHIYRVIGMFEA